MEAVVGVVRREGAANSLLEAACGALESMFADADNLKRGRGICLTFGRLQHGAQKA